MDELKKNNYKLASLIPFSFFEKKFFNHIEQLLISNQSFSYYYRAEDYYENIILYSFIQILYENMISNRSINPQTLKIGTPLTYDGNFFKYLGFDKKEKLYKLKKREAKHVGKNNSYTLLLTKRKFLSEVSIATKAPKGSSFVDVRKKLALSWNMTSFSRVSSNRIMIIADVNTRNKLENKKIKINNVEYYLGEIVSTVFVNKEWEEKEITHSTSKEKPIVYMFSDIITSVDFLQDNDDISKILVFGDQYQIGDKIQELNSLIALHKEFKIPICIFGTINALYDKNLIKDIKEIKKSYIWDDQISTLNNSFNAYYQFHSITVRSSFEKNIRELQSIIRYCNESYEWLYLSKLLSVFYRAVLGQASPTKDLLYKYRSETIQYAEEKRINSELKKEIQLITKKLIEDYYGYDVSNHIRDLINKKEKTGIVVDEKIYERAKMYYSYSHNITVIPSNIKVKEDLLDKLDSLIVCYVKAKDRRRWLLPHLVINYHFLYPSFEEVILIYSLKKDIRLLTEMNKTNDFLTKNFAKNTFLHQTKKFISELEAKKLIQDSETNRLEKGDEELFSYSEETNKSVIESIESIIEKNQPNDLNFKDKEIDTNIVTINFKISLNNKKVILGTDFGKFFINNKGVVEEKATSKLKKGDKIVEFNIPYSYELYRENEENKKEIDIPYYEQSELDKRILADLRWKQALINYRDSRGLTINEVIEKFERVSPSKWSEGFLRSWMNPKTLSLVPRQQTFIRDIGIVTNNKYIEEHYEALYRASEYVKNFFRNFRDDIISKIAGKQLSEIKQIEEIKGIEIATVNKVVKVDGFEVPRYLTNNMIEGE